MATQLTTESGVSKNLGNITIFTYETNKNKVPQPYKFNFYFINCIRLNYCAGT